MIDHRAENINTGENNKSGNIFCARCSRRLTPIHYKDDYERTAGSLYHVDQIKGCFLQCFKK